METCSDWKWIFCTLEFNNFPKNAHINGTQQNRLGVKALQSVLAPSVLKCSLVCCNACNLYLIFHQIPSTCLKLSSSSTVIPSRTTSWDFSILFPSRSRVSLMSVFVPNIINWNLPRFSFNEFPLNHFRICPKSNLRLCNISPKIFPQEFKCYHQQNYICQILR